MKIYFIRHGRTGHNAGGRATGTLDIPLSKEGFYQAAYMSNELKNFKFDIVFCSPLQRTIQTAQVIMENQNCPLVLDDRIIERDCGDLTGSTYSELENHPKWSWVIGDSISKEVNAETIDEMIERVSSFLSDIKKYHANKKILIVSHSGVANVIHAITNKFEKGTNALCILIKNTQLKEFEI